jgi:anti-sigma factor RsiW
LRRPFERHIDDEELNALAPSLPESGQEIDGLSLDAVREAERHLRSCMDCSRKVSKYRQVVSRLSNAVVAEATPPGADCPKGKDVDWHEVAAGLWPELKATQLIMHAAVCGHCGPLLRASISVDDDPTPQEEKLLAELKAPSQPPVKDGRQPILINPRPPIVSGQILQWKILIPAIMLMVTIGVLGLSLSLSPAPLSGSKFAEFAVSTHRQHAQGILPLDVRLDSQQMLNQWLSAKSPFPLALPASPAAPGEERPYRLEGARLMPVAGKSAAYIAYQAQTGLVSLIVTPDSVAAASGGVEVDFKKVSFHYRTVRSYKVVTWSLHGLTYALVSQEGNRTQRSCMICHSAMRDRDLSQTPAPLSTEKRPPELLLQ